MRVDVVSWEVSFKLTNEAINTLGGYFDILLLVFEMSFIFLEQHWESNKCLLVKPSLSPIISLQLVLRGKHIIKSLHEDRSAIAAYVLAFRKCKVLLANVGQARG